MRGQPQAASARVLAGTPGRRPNRRWSTWLEERKENRRRIREERLEMIVRLEADERRARRKGAYVPDVRRPW